MSSDGSFPHQRPEPDEVPSAEEEHQGGRVIEFPSEDLPTPTPIGSMPVPAGTWADESEEAEPEVDRLLKPAGVRDWSGGAEVVEFPRQPATQRRLKEAPADESGEAPIGELTKKRPIKRLIEEEAQEVSGTQATHAPTETGEVPDEEEAKRPQYLASELLDRDWYPKHPLKRTLRWAAIVIGVLGAVATPVLGGLAPDSLGLAVLFALCAAAGIFPLSPSVRGLALAAVGAAGAISVGWLSTVTQVAEGAPLLIGAVTLAVSALFFRAAHNRSALARTLVAVGLGACVLWLALTGGIDAMVVQSWHWQAWIEPSSRVLLVIIALLAVLTFLDPTSHGGSWVAGFALVFWLGLSSGGGFVLDVFPIRGEPIDPANGTWTARAALPLFVAVASGGLCQVWVMLSRRARASEA